MFKAEKNGKVFTNKVQKNIIMNAHKSEGFDIRKFDTFGNVKKRLEAAGWIFSKV